MSVQFTYATYTHQGGRKINEDSIGVFHNGSNHCFIVCDGLGGHGMGDVASSIVVDVFENLFSKTYDLVSFMDNAFVAAEDILIAEQIEKRAQRKMKTTAVAIATNEKNAYVGHVGDSRGYIFHKNKVKKRTKDHSIPQMLALSGEIKENEIRNHPDRNIVLRVIGVEWENPMQEIMAPIKLKKNMSFLLCTDGFWELIEEEMMCNLLKKAETVEQWLSDMLTIVQENGAEKEMDNYSAIAVWCR